VGIAGPFSFLDYRAGGSPGKALETWRKSMNAHTKAPEIEPLLLGTKGVACLTGLAESTVRAMMADGRLKSLKIGDRRLSKHEWVLELIDRCEADSASASAAA
jgi:hypothetical protein